MRLILLVLFLAAAVLAHATPACSSQSPQHRVPLVELYTSEGCSSCPPMDAYISGLRGSALADGRAVVLALHVDYWDYIGWKDRFASPAFTRRQHELAGRARHGTVYTPEVFVDGREQYPARRLQDEVVRLERVAPAASITLGGAIGTDGKLQLRADARSAQPARLQIAVTEDGLSSRIGAGENRGSTLHHDAVVRAWLDPVELAPVRGLHAVAVDRAIALPAGANPAGLRLAAFVQGSDGEVLQAWSQPVCVP
jgi:hypothetical protein